MSSPDLASWVFVGSFDQSSTGGDVSQDKNYCPKVKDGYSRCGSLSCAQWEGGTLVPCVHLLELLPAHSGYTANICGMNSVFLIGWFSRTALPFEHT